MGLEIDVLSVGNGSKGGDAIAFRYGDLLNNPPRQNVIIVDGGYSTNGDKLYEIVTERYKTNKIYIVLLTHPDGDHVQGLKRLFEYEDIEVDYLIMHCPWNNPDLIKIEYEDGRITNNSIQERLKKTFSYVYELSILAKEKGTTIIEPCVGSYNLAGGAILKILAPDSKWYLKKILESDKTPECGVFESKEITFSIEDEFEDCKIGENVEWKYDDPHTTAINETSIVSLFEYEGNKILFTGDIGRVGLQLAVEEAKKQKEPLTDLKIFISPHHGSRKNMTPELMDDINADYTIFSTPPEGDPHHPSRRLINKYIEKGHRLFSTSGSEIHWGVECPERNWGKAEKLSFFSEIEKNA